MSSIKVECYGNFCVRVAANNDTLQLYQGYALFDIVGNVVTFSLAQNMVYVYTCRCLVAECGDL